MAGFSLNLKKGGNTGTKAGFKAKKGVGLKKSGDFQGSDDDLEEDERQKVSIDSFDIKKGAMKGDISINKKNAPLVIKQAVLSTSLKRNLPNQYSKEELEMKIEEEKKSKLLYGITKFEKLETGQKSKLEDLFQQSIDDAPSEDSDEEYAKVPVEQFGAAMLRGMGWKENTASSKSQPSLENRKKSQLLGIGAKPLESDLINDIMGKDTKIEVPLLKRKKLE